MSIQGCCKPLAGPPFSSAHATGMLQDCCSLNLLQSVGHHYNHDHTQLHRIRPVITSQRPQICSSVVQLAQEHHMASPHRSMEHVCSEFARGTTLQSAESALQCCAPTRRVLCSSWCALEYANKLYPAAARLHQTYVSVYDAAHHIHLSER